MIAIIDYGAGNIKSVFNALDKLQCRYTLTRDHRLISDAEKVILPGVGHSGHAINALEHLDLIDTIKNLSNPFLGICVGMQLLYDYCEEGNVEGLRIVPGKVTKFDRDRVIVPLMGWTYNKLNDNPLFENISSNTWLYSVHSYRAEINKFTIASSTYAGQYATAVQKNNFYGVQFHPEKSGVDGLKILKNFIKL